MSCNIKVVRAGEEDIPLIRSIAQAVWPQVYSGLLSDKQISYMMNMMYSADVIASELASGCKWYLLEYEKETAGYFSIYFTGEVCKLDKLYIKPQFRRCGVGRQAIRFAADTAQEHGAKQLILNVNKYNTSAQKAYSSYGFTHLRDEVNDIGNGFVMDDYVLALEIK